MTAESTERGHPVYFDSETGTWKYGDTGMMSDGQRLCAKCGKLPGEAGIDPCLMPLIAALNGAGLKTLASCCGHGRRPASVLLDDGREIIVARSWEEARLLEKAIPSNINGEVTGDEPT